MRVKFETAELAREVGYKERGDNVHPYNYAYTSDGEYWERVGWKAIGMGLEFSEAPLQYQLQTWLRDKHSIHVEVIWVDTLSNVYIHRISTTGNGIRPDSVFYHSYEEALEMGLQEALKLLMSWS